MRFLALLPPLLCCATTLLLLHPVLGSFPILGEAHLTTGARSLALSPLDPSLLYYLFYLPGQPPAHYISLHNLTINALPDPSTIDINPLLLPHGYTTPTQLTTLRTDSSTPSFYLFDDANHLLFVITYPSSLSPLTSSSSPSPPPPTITAFAPERALWVSTFSLSPDGSIVTFNYLDDLHTLTVYTKQGRFLQSISLGGALSTAAFPPALDSSAPATFFFVNSSQPRRADGVYVLDFGLVQWSLSTGQQVDEAVRGSIPAGYSNSFFIASLVMAWDGTFVLCGSSDDVDNPCCFFDAHVGTMECDTGYSGGYYSTTTVDGWGRLATLASDFKQVVIYDTTNGSVAHTHTTASSSSSSVSPSALSSSSSSASSASSSSSASQRRLPSSSSSSTVAADSSSPAPLPPASLSSSSTAAAGCACSTTPSCESGWSTAAVVAIALSCLCAGVLLGVVLLRVLQVFHERREDKRVQHSPAVYGVRSPMLGHMRG